MDKRPWSRLSILYLIITLAIINLLLLNPHTKSPHLGKTSPHIDLYIVSNRTQTGSNAKCQNLTLIL